MMEEDKVLLFPSPFFFFFSLLFVAIPQSGSFGVAERGGIGFFFFPSSPSPPLLSAFPV